MSEIVNLSAPEGIDAQHSESAQKMTVGETLALARSNQELSVEQIAGQLKWSARQITEIEAGNYAVFPDMLSVRGFVRTYAKFLKIDSAPLMDELTLEFEKMPVRSIDRPKLDMPFPKGRMPWRQNNNSQKLFAGFVLLCLFFVAGFVYRSEILGMIPGSAAIQMGERHESPAQPASVVEPKPEVVNPLDSKTAVPEVRSVAPTTSSGDKEKTEPAPQENSPAVENTSENNNANVDIANALVLNFKQDSWLQVKRLDGSVMISHLYKAGSQEVLPVSEPLNIVIGNAPGVETRLRGQDLVLHPQEGSNVVNLSVK